MEIYRALTLVSTRRHRLVLSRPNRDAERERRRASRRGGGRRPPNPNKDSSRARAVFRWVLLRPEGRRAPRPPSTRFTLQFLDVSSRSSRIKRQRRIIVSHLSAGDRILPKAFSFFVAKASHVVLEMFHVLRVFEYLLF